VVKRRPEIENAPASGNETDRQRSDQDHRIQQSELPNTHFDGIKDLQLLASIVVLLCMLR
jgi:hypothetical protein